MKIWVMTEIYDDSDPGDKASLSSVRTFLTLQAAREAFWTDQGKFSPSQRGFLVMDADPSDIEDEFMPDAPEGLEDDAFFQWAEEQAAKEPEKYRWTNGNTDGGWDGGKIVEIIETEVEG